MYHRHVENSAYYYSPHTPHHHDEDLYYDDPYQYDGAHHPSSIYQDPANSHHPHLLPQNNPQDLYYYPPHPYPHQSQQQRQASIYAPPPSNMQPAVQHEYASRPIPPALANDPAFSGDPRLNPTNPLAHYTAFAMNSREEILPSGVGHDHDVRPPVHVFYACYSFV